MFSQQLVTTSIAGRRPTLAESWRCLLWASSSRWASRGRISVPSDTCSPAAKGNFHWCTPCAALAHSLETDLCILAPPLCLHVLFIFVQLLTLGWANFWTSGAPMASIVFDQGVWAGADGAFLWPIWLKNNYITVYMENMVEQKCCNKTSLWTFTKFKSLLKRLFKHWTKWMKFICSLFISASLAGWIKKLNGPHMTLSCQTALRVSYNHNHVPQ